MHLAAACRHKIALHSLPTSVRNQKQRSRKLLRSLPEVVNYLLKTFATSQAIAEYGASTLSYMPPSIMIPQQYAENIFPMSCTVADVYDDSKINGVVIDGAGSLI